MYTAPSVTTASVPATLWPGPDHTGASLLIEDLVMTVSFLA
jgi:hypothetical protein